MGISMWSRLCLCVTFMLTMLAGSAWAAPVKVWVQPSGNTVATAYAKVSEARVYFGRTEGGGGSYQYKWEFSDGVGNTAFANVGTARYITSASKAFTTAGTHWARLTVRDTADPANLASAQIDLRVIAVADDNLNRQKNSAIDRGLRNLYQIETISGTTSYWNQGHTVGDTGMALIAFENHGHNLQSSDTDIYKKSVTQGIQYLLNQATKPDISTQRCIGNPDTNGNGKGVVIGSASHIYDPSIALLALVNSADKAYAQSHTAVTSNTVNGMTLFDIAVDATDWMAWAQSDGSTGGASTTSCNYAGYPLTAYYSGATVSDLQGYFYTGNVASLGGCGGTFNINWGDGSSSTYIDNQQWCGYNGANTAYPELSYYSAGPNHTYAANGSYTISYSYVAGGITTALCSANLNVSAGVTGCSATDAQSGAGGWSYGPNEARGDNSLTQWAVLGISEAKTRWDIDVNPAVVTQLAHWLNYSQCADGSFGYTGPGSWCNYQKVGAGLIMLEYVGKTESDASVQNALNYAKNNWNTTGGEWNMDNLYSMYGMYKAMKVMGRTDVGNTTATGQGWVAQYDQNLITRQNADGSWSNLGGWMAPATAAAVAILAPEVASLPPVANAGGPYSSINAYQSLTLNGANSYHQDPARSLVLYQWDFDAANGLWWDSKAAPDAGEGAVGVNPSVSYPATGSDKTYTVTLRVSDDTTPTSQRVNATATINVTSGNVAPTARTNGPWSTLPNTEIVFDGSSSSDPNACTTAGNPACLNDSIVSYEWDLDGNGVYNDANDGTPVTANRMRVKKTFANPVSLPAKLRVTDSFGLKGTTTDSNINIVSIALVYGQQYETCYRTPINRTSDRLGLRIKFKNRGTGTASNLVMTLTSTPTNLTRAKSVANLGTLAPNAEVLTQCNPTTKTADIELIVDRRVAPTGQWLWKGDFDFNGNHYTVDNVAPISN